MALSHGELFHIFHPFIVGLGWEFMLNLVIEDCWGEESEWLVRWLTTGKSLVLEESDYSRFIQALAIVGPDILVLDKDNKSESSFHPSEVELEIDFLDSEGEVEEYGYGLPQGLLRILLPREEESAPVVATHVQPPLDEAPPVVLPFGMVNAPAHFQRSLGPDLGESSHGR